MDWKERNLKLAWDWWKEYGKPDDDLVNIPEALIAFGEFYNAEMTAERDQLRTELDAARKQMSDIEQALHTVNILNNELYAQYDEVDSSFLVVTDGHAVRIDFDTIPVWCIVRDGREYIEDTGELVDFTYMIRKRFNGIVERLAGFKFNLSDKEV